LNKKRAIKQEKKDRAKEREDKVQEDAKKAALAEAEAEKAEAALVKKATYADTLKAKAIASV